MTIEEAKNIRLVDYLQSLGYTPVRQQGANLWYKSPFREETKASFKVNTEINKWYDFGLGQGGNNAGEKFSLFKMDGYSLSHWFRNFTVPSTCRIYCNGLRSRHRTLDPCPFLFGSSPPQSQIFSVWK